MAPVAAAPAVTTPVSNTAVTTPAEEQPAVDGEAPPPDGVEFDGYEPPKKGGKGKLVGWLVLGLAVVAGGIFWMSTRSGSSGTAAAPPPNATLAVTDSTSVQPPQVVAGAPLPGEKADSVKGAPAAAVGPKPDSAALADSIKKAALAKKAKADSLKKVARADSLKKAAAKEDSIKRAENSNRTKARSAAIWLFADPGMRSKFTDGATHMGGVLGTKRMGDLQSQIDALTPFLKRAGITYDEFKAVMQESGIKIFDEYGRMVPDSLKKFTGVSKL
jgi:hypothetical protein